MKNIRILAVLLVFTLAASTLAACGGLQVKPIADTNGPDDKALVTITDDMFTKKVSGSMSTTSTSLSGSRSKVWNTDTSDPNEDIDYDHALYQITALNGTVRVLYTRMKAGWNLSFGIKSTVTAGNYGGALVDPNGFISARFKATGGAETGISVTSTAEGDYYLVIGGESMAGTVEITRSISQ
jgi:hypothetical protein